VDLTGKTTADLHLTNVKESDAGSYDCVISNACFNVNSSPATLKVNKAGPGPVLTLKYSTIDFGLIKVSTQKDSAFTGLITNSGTEALIISSSDLSGDNAADFSMTGFDGAVTLQAGESQSVSLGFKPSTEGIKNAIVEFQSNASTNPVLSLTGIGGESKITSTVPKIEFEAPDLSTPVEKSIDLKNEGNLDADVTLEISGDNASAFSIVSPGSTFKLLAGQSQSLTVNFHPASVSEGIAQIVASVNGVPDQLFIYLMGTVNTSGVDESIVNSDNISVVPNPSTNGSRFEFTLPENKIIDIAIVDIAGHSVKSFGSKMYSAGSNSLFWDGIADNGSKSPSGDYRLIFRIGNSIKTFPVILTK
jgi:hypothetical protein